MKAKDNNANKKANLKEAIEALRSAAPRQHEVEEAAARVWARVSEAEAAGTHHGTAEPETLRSCEDYRLLIEPYLAGELGRARVLLLEDHSSECLACRKAISAARREKTGRVVPIGGSPGWPRVPGGLAAVAGIAAALVLGFLVLRDGIVRQILFPAEISATAQTVRGRLFRVNGPDLVALEPGDEIGLQEPVRTARDSGAILELSDGSRIEMRERSQLRLGSASDGIRVRLDRGSVIVEAADQGTGHLYVSTDEVDVAVVGTVFSVSEGSKGARVSVIEGEVRVEQGETVRSLFPGQQFNSSEALTAVPISEEIAWSQSREAHIELMLRLSELSQELVAATRSEALRYSSTLLPRAPADAVIYVAFPNVARSIANAYDVFRARVEENEITREWWNQVLESGGDGDRFDAANLETMMGYLRSFAEQIGDEVVVAVGMEEGPLVLAELVDAELVADVLRGLAALGGGNCTLRVATSLEELAAIDPSACGPVAFAGDGLLAVSPSHAAIQGAVSGGSGGAGTFLQSVATVYDDGADWLFAADLDGIRNRMDQELDPDDGEARAVASLLGSESVDGLFVDYKSISGHATTRAALTFNGPRSGIPSWIAEAGPMGGLDFVSPDAMAVASGLTRDTGSIVGELFLALQRIDPDAWGEIVQFQQEHRFDLQYDLASALGGEFVLALDGPFLPTPSWKVVVEVYNSAALQSAIERMIFEFNRVAALEGDGGTPQLEVQAETSGGQIFYVVRFVDGGPDVEMHYTFAGGYMVAGPSLALVNQSVEYYQTQTTLENSAAFRALLPAGSQQYCSGIVYQNVASVAASLSEWIPASVLEADELQAIETMITGAGPMLGCVIAEESRILALNEGDSPFNLLTLGGLQALMGQFAQVAE